MNRITKKFNELQKDNKTAFIGYVTAGDPSIDKTYELVLAMEKGGADIIEIGIPYSDPLADGPVIQAAGLRAFENDIKVAQSVLNVLKRYEKTAIYRFYLWFIIILFSIWVMKNSHLSVKRWE